MQHFLSIRYSINSGQAAALLLFALAATGTTEAATRIYKSVDAEGNVVYTDVAPPEADRAEQTEIRIEAPNTFDNAPAPAEPGAPALVAEDEAVEDEEIVYSSLLLTGPADDEAIRSNNGDLTLYAAVAPGLAETHRLRFFVDGQPVGTTSSTSLALSNLDRGTHQAQVVILDEAGNAVMQSAVHAFHILRYSIRLAP